jgi:hypothetical protein
MGDHVRYEQFAAMMSEINLWQVYGGALLDSGFDEWLSIKEIDDRLLQDIGVLNETDRLKIVACVEAARSIDFEADADDETNGRRAELMGSDDFKYSQSIAPGKAGSKQVGFSALKFDSQPADATEAGPGGETEERLASQEVSLYPQQLVRTIAPSVNKVQRWSYTKIHRHESDKKYFHRIMNLYIKTAGLNKIVLFVERGEPGELPESEDPGPVLQRDRQGRRPGLAEEARNPQSAEQPDPEDRRPGLPARAQEALPHAQLHLPARRASVLHGTGRADAEPPENEPP